MQTNSYDAQYGRIGGRDDDHDEVGDQLDLHGQLFEFFKNDKLNTADMDCEQERRGADADAEQHIRL